MNRYRPANRVSVTAYLRTAAINAPGTMPVADLAELAVTAWRETVGHGTDIGPDPYLTQAALDALFERRRCGADAVAEAVYPHGLTAGQTAGAEALASHVVDACADAASSLSDDNDPGRVTRRLLSNLTIAAQREAQRSRAAKPSADFPTATTYLAAYGDGKDQHDPQRVATAVRVAWTRGFEDGWSQAYYWTANLILGAVHHDEGTATSSIHGTPTLAWLNDLLLSARQIATDGQAAHTRRLAQLAGAAQPPTQIDRRTPAPNDTTATRETPTDTSKNSYRRPRRT